MTSNTRIIFHRPSTVSGVGNPISRAMKVLKVVLLSGKFKVFYSIVSFNLVLVVNYLRRLEFSAKMLFHYVAMFKSPMLVREFRTMKPNISPRIDITFHLANFDTLYRFLQQVNTGKRGLELWQ